MSKRVIQTVYETPKEGKYRFEYYMGEGHDFIRQSMDVKILAETDKRFLIRLPLPIRGHNAGDEFWVTRRKVTVRLDTSDYWFNNFESREL